MEKVLTDYLKDSKMYQDINSSQMFLSKKKYFKNSSIENPFFFQSSGNGSSQVSGNVVGSGDNTANANNIVINYDSTSWGQIIDLGQVPLNAGKRIIFEPNLFFPINNFTVEIGIRTVQTTSKTFTKTLYPNVSNIVTETDPIRNNGISYRFNSNQTHSFFLNGTLSSTDTNLNFTGNGLPTPFWLFNNSEYITISTLNNTSALFYNQRGDMSYVLGAAMFAYIVIYKLTEQVHSTIRFTFRNDAQPLDSIFNTIDAPVTNWKRYELFKTHPQNYSMISVIPSKLTSDREMMIKFEGVNDIATQKIYVGITSNPFKRDYSLISDFDQFVNLRYGIDSSGSFQSSNVQAFSSGKNFNIVTDSTNATITCETQSFTLINAVGNYIFVGIKYDSPINIKCIVSNTIDLLLTSPKTYYVKIPRNFNSVYDSFIKLPQKFSANLSILGYSSSNNVKITLTSAYGFLQNDVVASPNFISTEITLNPTVSSYFYLFTQLFGYSSNNSNPLCLFGATHNQTMTMYKVDDWFYFNSNTTSFGFRLLTGTGEVYLGLAWSNIPLTQSDGTFELGLDISNFSTNVTEPVNLNYFTTEGTSIFIDATVTTTDNVGQFRTIASKIWGDFSFNSNLRNAFTWKVTTTFTFNVNRCFFIGLVTNSSTLTASTFNTVNDFKNAITTANGWGYYFEGVNGDSSGYYRNGILTVGTNTLLNNGFGFYNGNMFACAFHTQNSEITQWFKIGTGITRSNAYQLVWGSLSNSIQVQFTLYSGKLKGYFD
jgi:hypothetical protein